ncbi:MAG: hypothetical protein H6Q24_1031 [Bacteroidetes bacterium]|nr:hypothetical protein [Bacteroidota bacterium]
MVIYSLSQILSEAGGPGNERLMAGGSEPGAEGREQNQRQKTKVVVKRRS